MKFIDLDIPLVRLQDRHNMFKKDALPATGPADDHDRLPFLDGQIDPTQHMVIPEPLMDVFDLDHETRFSCLEKNVIPECLYRESIL